MHLVTAIVKPHRVEAVTEALKDAGVSGMTVAGRAGFRRQRGHTEVYRGSEYKVDFLPKVMVDVLSDVGRRRQDRRRHRRRGPHRQDRRREDLDHRGRPRCPDPHRRDGRRQRSDLHDSSMNGGRTISSGDRHVPVPVSTSSVSDGLDLGEIAAGRAPCG